MSKISMNPTKLKKINRLKCPIKLMTFSASSG